MSIHLMKQRAGTAQPQCKPSAAVRGVRNGRKPLHNMRLEPPEARATFVPAIVEWRRCRSGRFFSGTARPNPAARASHDRAPMAFLRPHLHTNFIANGLVFHEMRLPQPPATHAPSALSDKPMKDLFSRFDFHAAKFDGQVWLCLGIIWLLILFCTIVSIRSRPFSSRQRRLWIFVVCAAPLAGVLAYLPFSCRWEHLAQLLFLRPKVKQKGKDGSNSRPTGGGRAS